MCYIKLRMEMGNVPKRQKPDHRKKTTAEGHQQVFNVARNSRTRRRPSTGPKQIYTSSVIMNAILISKLYTRN